ncbi:deoxyhypusine synthase family protein, partial [Candidatus Micrarchaeota archaeon]|nr:deoxyhypusine synthase family protein [Candidatus Micrarchaeota archaeon]
MKPVKDIQVKPTTHVNDLITQYFESGGFTAKKLGVAAGIMKSMSADKKCFKFLSFPACIISTGTRGVIRDFVKEKKFDAVITTCGTLDHDLARVWQDYYHGDFNADDAKLRKQGINRLGNIFIPNSSYGEVLEKKLAPMLEKIYKNGARDIAPYELVWLIGEQLENEKKKDESIVYWAYKNKIPVFIPGITDGSVGFQLHMFMQDHKDFRVDVFKDERKLEDIVFNNKITG